MDAIGYRLESLEKGQTAGDVTGTNPTYCAAHSFVISEKAGVILNRACTG